MRSVTEFLSLKLLQGIKMKEALAAEGKTPEEIQQTIGESFKMEGDKLKHFTNAMDVASQNTENLFRVLVVSVSEGETIPPKSTKVDEHYYIPEFPQTRKAASAEKPAGKGDRGRGGRGKGKRQ